MKGVFFVFSLFLLFLPFVQATAETDVTGEWEITTTTPRGDRTAPVTFVQSGEELKVKMRGRRGGELEGKGSVKGGKIEWTVLRNTPRGEFKLTYSGTIQGNQMEGEVEFGSVGSGKWTAQRAASE